MADTIKKQKNITTAMLGSYFPVRGISPYCAELSNSLSNYITNIKFLSFKKIYPAFIYPDGKNQSDSTANIYYAPNIEIKRRICWNNPVTWISEAYSSNFDIFHAQWWSLPLWPVYFVILYITKLRKKPVIITVHNVLPHEASIVYRILTSLLFKTADHFIVHTQINKTQLSSCFKIPEKKISIIQHGPIGLYCDSDNIDEKVENTLKKELHINKKCRIILIFGAIREYKGIDVAIKALQKISDTGIDCHLVIAGKAWIPWKEYDKLINQLSLDKKVSCFTDYIQADQVKSFFNAADLVILPYKHFDAQSGVASVAGSFGKPMIVSDTGGLADWVADKKWALPPGNVDALALAMKECLEDQGILDKMANDSRKMAQLYSWDSIAKKTSELYEKILENRL